MNHIEKLAAYFTPGKIVPSYGGRDVVVRFEDKPANCWASWRVWVKEIDAKGNIVGQERWHCTEPKLLKY